jgi:acyl-CoA-binding protein
VDRNSIDELMKLYYRFLQGTDGEHEKDGAPVVIGDAGHDDMFDGLPSVADVSDLKNSPIWQWV